MVTVVVVVVAVVGCVDSCNDGHTIGISVDQDPSRTISLFLVGRGIQLLLLANAWWLWWYYLFLRHWKRQDYLSTRWRTRRSKEGKGEACVYQSVVWPIVCLLESSQLSISAQLGSLYAFGFWYFC